MVLDVRYNGNNIGKGLYDPRANSTAITLNALKKIPNYQYVPTSSHYNTTSGPGIVLGLALLDLTILDITKRVVLSVIDPQNFNFDFIIGTDYIPDFRLNLDCNLKITQSAPISINVTALSSPSIWNEYMPRELFNDKVKHLSPSQQSAILNFVTNNINVFGKDKFDVGNVSNYTCPINLSTDSYVAKKPYRCSFTDQQEIDRQCQELLRKGMICESTSPFAAPVTLQYKKDGLGAHKIKTRMCCDYRELNKLIIPESHPFPLIDDIIVKTQGCSWFSAFDINAAFHSIPIDPKHRHRSAFVTQSAHYEWCSMPFGLKTSSAVFQRIISGIIRRYKMTDYAESYLDDILVFSKTFEEHLVHIQNLVDAIYAEGFRLNFKKCSFASPSIQYLGHILSPNSVQPLCDNIVAITDFPIPSSRRSVRQFLGKVNFYRKFIPNSSSLLEPFHNLLRKHVRFSWSPECQMAFDTVKTLLTSSPILAIFDRNSPISIYTDASGIGIAAVLKQRQADGSEKPVAYFSKKLTEGQMKKKAIYLESLAIREAIRYWRYWLIGRSFTVITDHKPLEHLNLKARTDEELGDFALELSQFDFDIIYRPGKDNCEADCLSRNPVNPPSPDLAVPETILPSFNFLSLDDLVQSQQTLPRTNSDIIRHGVIFRKFHNKHYIALDEQSGSDLIARIHSHYGHIGPKHMFSILRPSFYFPHMTRLVFSFCKSCSVCTMNKSRRARIHAKLGFFGPASRPYEVMSLDTIGGFSNNSSSMRYIHLLVDHFSRHAWILCSKGQTAREMISLVESVHQSHPIGTLLTDQYGGLLSKEFRSYCTRSRIRHIFTAVDSASSNGLNERVNQSLVNKIRCLRNDPSLPSRINWTTLAKQCVSQYNSTPHSVTSFCPSYLLTGVPSSPLPSVLVDSPSYESDKLIALENTLKYHAYNKARYDKNKLDVTFNVGDLVYVSNGNKLNREKLDVLRIGPYPITRKLSNNVFEVSIGCKQRSRRLYHASKILLAPV